MKNPAFKTNLRHGATGTPLYRSWINMRARCKPGSKEQERTPSYVGVECDPRWATFEGFLAYPPVVPDGHPYEPGMALARVNDRGDYSPENARWRTKRENAQERFQVTT